MTTNTFNVGIAGLRAAETRLHVRAQNIVNWQSVNYIPQVPVQTSDATGSPIVVSRPVELIGDFPYVDIAAEIVDMELAKHAYRASAKVIRTAGEMSKTLLDALA